jgi:glycerate 2-kinase
MPNKQLENRESTRIHANEERLRVSHHPSETVNHLKVLAWKRMGAKRFKRLNGGMRILVAPDKFKGSMTAMEAAGAIRKGWKKVFPRAQFDLAPLSDGGDGFLEALVASSGGKVERVPGVEDALFRRTTVPLGWIDQGSTAVIELAQVCGLAALAQRERNPLKTTTFGMGRLIRHATRKGAKRILVGLGGSATNDGGMGLAAALGVRFLDARGREISPVGGNLGKIHRIDRSALEDVSPIVAAVDVRNPLFGAQGAAWIFSPQKGATPAQVRLLDRGLRHFAGRAGIEAARLPGAGAAGGTSYGMIVFAGAKLSPGFDIVAQALGLAERVKQADLVITGEGCLDAQTAFGKAPEQMRALAAKAGKPVFAFAGVVRQAGKFQAAFPLVEVGDDPAPAMASPAGRLERIAARAAAAYACGWKMT